MFYLAFKFTLIQPILRKRAEIAEVIYQAFAEYWYFCAYN